MQVQRKPNNLKTGLILASVALMFFLGVFVKRIWFS
ncbi:MAG TPA: cytochrome oxidase small assembly protein [Burkholderiaceae bacterium]|nr:cytochrome oxidase small assembly protein [Burkholderiaceae bacterium]